MKPLFFVETEIESSPKGRVQYRTEILAEPSVSIYDFKFNFSPFRIPISNDLSKLVSKHSVRRHIYDMCTINLEIHRLRVDRTAYIERSVAPSSSVKGPSRHIDVELWSAAYRLYVVNYELVSRKRDSVYRKSILQSYYLVVKDTIESTTRKVDFDG